MGGVKCGQKAKINKLRKGGRTPLDKQPATTPYEREPLIEGIETESTLNALDEMDQESPFEIIYMFQTSAEALWTGILQQGVKTARLQYAYFPLETLCIQQKFPEYKKEVLVISKESSEVVPEEVKTKLRGMEINIWVFISLDNCIHW